jgi:hypothetical protein
MLHDVAVAVILASRQIKVHSQTNVNFMYEIIILKDIP